MFSKNTLKEGMRLRAKAGLGEKGSDIRVAYPRENSCIFIIEDTGAEEEADYGIVESLYEIIPTIEPTAENFIERLDLDIDEMIANMGVFNEKATTVDYNMIAIGTKLITISAEVKGYLGLNEPGEEEAKLLGN